MGAGAAAAALVLPDQPGAQMSGHPSGVTTASSPGCNRTVVIAEKASRAAVEPELPGA